MLITGIALQLLAGIIFGLAHVLPESYFESANRQLKRFLFLPFSTRRYQIRIPLIGALVIPVALLIAILIVVAFEPAIDTKWYEALGGILLGSLFGATFYLALLQKLSQIQSRTKDLRELPDDVYSQVLFVSNILLILVFTALCLLSYFGVISLLGAGRGLQAFAGAAGFLLILLMTISFLAAVSSLVFLLVAVIVKLTAKMAQADRALWIIVLTLYVLGGAFLIAHACQSG